MDTAVLGVSVNKSQTNKGFAEKMGVEFPLLSDRSKSVAKQYGALAFFRLAKRVTFLVDKRGVIRHVDRGSAAADPSTTLEAAKVLR